MELRHIQLSDSLGDLVRLGIVFLKDVSNGAVSAVLRKRMEALAAELRQSIGDRPLSDIDPVKRTRRLYHLLGSDPTKDRPSSERLLRRVVQAKQLPKVNKLVDAMNLVSLSLQYPLGVYDWDKIVPPVLVRIGRPDESYPGLSGDPVNLEGKLVLVDGESLFGNPSHDSARTQVGLGTVRSLVVAWASAETPKAELESVLEEIKSLAREFCDARAGETGILG